MHLHFMFSHLSQYFSRSKSLRKGPNDKTRTGLHINECLSISSYRSSSVQKNFGTGISSSQVLPNDPQSIHDMDKIPLACDVYIPRKLRIRESINTLYEAAHERDRGNASETEERYRWRDDSVLPFPDETQWDNIATSQNSERKPILPPRSRLRSDISEWEAQQYTSTDHYYGPPIYQNTFPARPSVPFQEWNDYDTRSDIGYTPPSTSSASPQIPTHPGPFRYEDTPSFPDYISMESYGQYHISNDSSLPPTSSSRHPQYSRVVYLQPSPLQDLHDSSYTRTFASTNEIPITRMTRLKRPVRTFPRDNGSKSDVGTRVDTFSRMVVHPLSTRNARGDVGGTTSSQQQPAPELRPSKVFSVLLL